MNDIPTEDLVERIKAFCEHLQREDHFDDERHQQEAPVLEKEFHANNEGPHKNIFLSARPSQFYEHGEGRVYRPR